MILRHSYRPWMIRDRAPVALPERRRPKIPWYDQAVTRVLGAFLPAVRRPAAADWAFAARVRRAGRRYDALDDEALVTAPAALRPALLREGLNGRACVHAFALAREATFRTLGYRHHTVQIVGARRILTGHLIEMATGEGKTATMALAAATAALAGIPVHVVTVNEYLCERDFETLAPIYARLGLSAARIDIDADMADKARDYDCAIVHVSNKTLVFDYLRGRLNRPALASTPRHAAALLTGLRMPPPPIPPALAFAIVDEADSVLIDEAQTPLIIAAPDARTSAEDRTFALSIAHKLDEGRDYAIRADARRVDLTPQGRKHIADATTGRDGLWQVPRARNDMVSMAVSALVLHIRDQHYIVAEDSMQIVDEFTGRVLADRQWQAGLHQMVEVKEGLEISAERKTLAQITFQEFFRRYLWFGGMSGTLREVSRECARVYFRPIAQIPTNRRVRRSQRCARLYRSEAIKLDRVAIRAARIAGRGRGRAVLIGTRSVEVSERLSAIMTANGTAHRILNARQDAEEAAIIAGAGEPGRITIATNMAGRGTDIGLSPQVRAAGGLHVIATEYHESGRIDRQLFGRAGRQGDPGSAEAMVALDDAVLRRFAPGLCRFLGALAPFWPGPLPGTTARLAARVAQARAERLARRNRAETLKRSEKMTDLLAFTGER